jgi:hypothetical protein
MMLPPRAIMFTNNGTRSRAFAMNCFQLIRSVLDEAYNAIPGGKAAKDAAIEEALGGLSKDYKNLLKKGCLVRVVTIIDALPFEIIDGLR